MTATKVMTIRIATDEAHRAEMAARVDEISVNEVFRRALAHYLELKRADPDFMERARAMIARDAEIVSGLQ